jgi:hypothetical protein
MFAGDMMADWARLTPNLLTIYGEATSRSKELEHITGIVLVTTAGKRWTASYRTCTGYRFREQLYWRYSA